MSDDPIKDLIIAAHSGDPNAQYLLGRHLEFTPGLEKSHAGLRGIVSYEFAEPYEGAASWYLKAAEQGDSRAQYSIGYCYAQGKGVFYDPNQAMQWYEKASDQGEDEAQSAIGLFYYQGVTVTKDACLAVDWWKKAAGFGNINAMCNLGYCHEKGIGTAKDPASAYAYYWLSAPSHETPRKHLTRFEACIAPHIVAEGKKRAEEMKVEISENRVKRWKAQTRQGY
jgi:TPR repeat protein